MDGSQPIKAEVEPVRLAPDSVTDFIDEFHAELFNDGTWGVVQTTRWQVRVEEWDCRYWAKEREIADLDWGLTEAQAREAVERLSGGLRRAA